MKRKHILFAVFVMGCLHLGAPLAAHSFPMDIWDITHTEVVPAEATIAVGGSLQFDLIGYYEDGSTVVLTEDADWQSWNSNVALVSDSQGSKGLATGISPGVASVQAFYYWFMESADLTVELNTLTSITLDPKSPFMEPGGTVQLTATGYYSNGDIVDLTDQVNWSSADPSIATIDSNGLSTGQQVGSTEITAEMNGVSESAQVVVYTEDIPFSIWPVDPSIDVDDNLQYYAIGQLAGGDTIDMTEIVTWEAEYTDLVAISDEPGSKGLATGLWPSRSKIHASLGTNVATSWANVYDINAVSLDMFPKNATIAKGDAIQFTATSLRENGEYYDMTPHVVWTSSDVSIAEIEYGWDNDYGQATAIEVGEVDITAQFCSHVVQTKLRIIDVDVDYIEIWPVDPTVNVEDDIQFYATGHLTDGSTMDMTELVVWEPEVPDLFSISNEPGSEGVATGLWPSRSRVFARFGTIEASTFLTVYDADVDYISISPQNEFIDAGETIQFTSTLHLNDGSTQDWTNNVVWYSSDHEIATIENEETVEGKATGHDWGNVQITARYGTYTAVTELWVF